MASAYVFIEPAAGVYGVSSTGTFSTGGVPAANPPFMFGNVQGATDPTYGYAEFMFVCGPAAGTCQSGDAVLLLNNTVQQLGTASTASYGPVAYLPAPMTASNVYGWAQIMGVADYCRMTNTVVAVGLPMVVGKTIGILQSAVGTTGYRIDGLKCSQYSATTNSNSGIMNLYYPQYEGRPQ